MAKSKKEGDDDDGTPQKDPLSTLPRPGSGSVSLSLSRRRSMPIYRDAPSDGMCQVCTVVPYQFHHFGAFVCNRCRAFFRRYIRR